MIDFHESGFRTERRDHEKRLAWQSDLRKVTDSCDRVQTYYAMQCAGYLDDESLHQVGSKFRNLKTIELHFCSVTDIGFENFLKALNENGRNLREIIMDKPGGITDHTVHLISEMCPNLKAARFTRCSDISGASLMALAKGCPKLKALTINNSVDKLDPCLSDGTGSIQRALGTHCLSLTSLHIFYSASLSYGGIKAVTTGCKFLRSVMLYECSGVDDECLGLLSKCKFLKALSLVNNDVTPMGVVHLLVDAPMLSRFTLLSTGNYAERFYGDMSLLAEEVFVCISERDNTPNPYRPNVLNTMILRGVGGAFLQLITVVCPNLITLDIRQPNTVTGRIIKSVLTNCDTLKNLDVQGIAKMDEYMIEGLVENGRYIQRLDLGMHVRDCSKSALVDMVRQCRMLSMIGMEWTRRAAGFLIDAIRDSHNGQCTVTLGDENDEEAEDKNRYIELNFTPFVYLDSLPRVAEKQDCPADGDDAEIVFEDLKGVEVDAAELNDIE